MQPSKFWNTAVGASAHPINRGVKNGEVWDPADVYTVRLPMMDGIKVIQHGQVLAGMDYDSPAATAYKKDDGTIHDKNLPMMPLAWTRDFESKSGKKARVFTTTTGTSQSIAYSGTRRLLVNACFWALGMESSITPKLDVSIVGEYKPTPFGFNSFTKGVKPDDLR